MVTYAGGSSSTDVIFVAGAPSSLTTTLMASPNALTANGTNMTTLSALVMDLFGNPVVTQTVLLSSTGSNNTITPLSGQADTLGVFTATMSSTTAETKSVTAGTAMATTNVVFTVGQPSSTTTTFSTNPLSVTADGTSTSTLTVMVFDVYNNPAQGVAMSIGSSGSNNVMTPSSGTTNVSGAFTATVPNEVVSSSVSGGNNTFNPSTGTTIASGVFTFTLSSTRTQTEAITATSGAASASTNVIFQAGAVSGGNTTLVADPNTLAADGSSQATLVVTALDTFGNAVPNQSVSMSANGSTNAFGASSGVTDGNDVFATTLSSTVVQTETVTATVNGSVTANANVTFITPTVSVLYSSIVLSPNTVLADGNATTAITVTVLTSNDAPVVNAAVTMSSTGTTNDLNPTIGLTDGAGVFTTTIASTQAALKVVTARVAGTALNTNVTFTPGAAVSTTSTLVASPNTVTADGASPSTLTVRVMDVHGNTVPGQSVALAASGGNNVWLPVTPSGTSDANGMFTATLVSTQEQTETITATLNGNFNETTAVIFVPWRCE